MNLTTYERTTSRMFRGRKVKLLRDVTSVHFVIRKGTVMTIQRKYRGFMLEAPPCEHCGIRARITKVPREVVELIELGNEEGM